MSDNGNGTGRRTFAELMEEAEGYVNYIDVFPRYIALLQIGMNEDDAFYLAYARALEYKNVEAMR